MLAMPAFQGTVVSRVLPFLRSFPLAVVVTTYGHGIRAELLVDNGAWKAMASPVLLPDLISGTERSGWPLVEEEEQLKAKASLGLGAALPLLWRSGLFRYRMFSRVVKLL